MGEAEVEEDLILKETGFSSPAAKAEGDDIKAVEAVVAEESHKVRFILNLREHHAAALFVITLDLLMHFECVVSPRPTYPLPD